MIQSVCVIICVYTERRWDDILAAIASIQAQTRKADEIILVVDHNEALADRLRAEIEGVRLLANIHAQGLSGARNSGIAASQSDLVAFLDDDAAAEPKWIEVLVEHFEDARVMGVGSWVTPLWSDRRPGWFPCEYLWVVGCSYTGTPTSLSETRNLFGGSMILRRSLFARIGGFDSRLGRDKGRLPLGCEETELCIRARMEIKEARFLLDPSVAITHRVIRERLTFKYFFLRCFAEGVSKQRLAAISGQRGGLSSEKRFLTVVLPGAFVKACRQFISGEPVALLRAFMLLTGFGAATAGFASSFVRALFPGRIGQGVASPAQGEG